MLQGCRRHVFFAAAALTGLLSNQRRLLLADLAQRNRSRMLMDDFFRVVATLVDALIAVLA